MLGELSFVYGGDPFFISCSNTSKVMQLFLLLLEAGKEGISRVQLLEALYGCDDTQDTKNAFRLLVFRLRKLLKESELPIDNYIKVKKGIYYFESSLAVEIDTRYFSKQAETAFLISEEEKRLYVLKEACDHYRGNFLPFLLDEEWAAAARLHYKEIYFRCLHEYCYLLKKRHQYKQILNLCANVAAIYPNEEWLLIQIECLMAMNQNREAMQIYKCTTELFFEKLNGFPSEKMLSRFQAFRSQMCCSEGSFSDIQENLKEKEEKSGAYYCDYLSFIDSYRVICRMSEKKNQPVFFMLCGITDSKGNLIEKKPSLEEQAAKLNQAIAETLRRSDIYTCCSPNQWLILLTRVKQEECRELYSRIYMKFREKCCRKNVYLRYHVSAVTETKTIQPKLSFTSLNAKENE